MTWKIFVAVVVTANMLISAFYLGVSIATWDEMRALRHYTRQVESVSREVQKSGLSSTGETGYPVSARYAEDQPK